MFELFTGGVEHAPRPHTLPIVVTGAVHALALVGVLVMPVLYITDRLPDVPDMMAFVAAVPDAPPPPPPPPPPKPAAPRTQPTHTPKPTTDALTVPVAMPERIEPEVVAEAKADEGVEGGVEGGVPGGVAGGVVGGLPAADPLPPAPPPPVVPAAPRGPVRIGGQVQAPALVHRVEPNYPALAVFNKIQGLVILEAIVDREGKVTDVRILRSANPVLEKEAMEAVRQWRYSPLLLNGSRERFVLTVTLSFRLEEGHRG